MPPESKVSLGPVLVTMPPRGGGALACRCAMCESRRATRLAQALRNRYGRSLALTEEITEP
jgi:hypothetical protein